MLQRDNCFTLKMFDFHLLFIQYHEKLFGTVNEERRKNGGELLIFGSYIDIDILYTYVDHDKNSVKISYERL